ncbi:MAG: hypothetical protein HC875_13240 [Anaerolineales bacterium]|nr:hypothetical protein [Anaerolineales bacterium]
MQPHENDPQNPYLTWFSLPELFLTSFPGVRPDRDELVLDIDREQLVRRMEEYFTVEVGSKLIPGQTPSGVEAQGDQLQQKRLLNHQIIRLCYRPFDLRWRFEGLETKPLSKKQLDYFRQVKPGNLWLAAAKKHRGGFDPPFVTSRPASQYLLESRTYFFHCGCTSKPTAPFLPISPKNTGFSPIYPKKPGAIWPMWERMRRSKHSFTISWPCCMPLSIGQKMEQPCVRIGRACRCLTPSNCCKNRRRWVKKLPPCWIRKNCPRHHCRPDSPRPQNCGRYESN